jgi:hypothetical protein
MAIRTKRETGSPALDPATGAIRLDRWDTVLEPSLTRARFLAAPVGQASGDLIVNEPWHSFNLPPCDIGGRSFAVSVFFEGEALSMIQLVANDPRFGTTWSDWSEAKEKARHVAHRRWLARQLGAAKVRPDPNGEQRFPWGKVWAGYDPRASDSSIVINYRARS